MVFFDNKIITLNSAYGSKQNGTMSSFVQFNFQGLLKEENSIIRSYISVVNAQFPHHFIQLTMSIIRLYLYSLNYLYPQKLANQFSHLIHNIRLQSQMVIITLHR